jgi:hypothetical protein
LDDLEGANMMVACPESSNSDSDYFRFRVDAIELNLLFESRNITSASPVVRFGNCDFMAEKLLSQ